MKSHSLAATTRSVPLAACDAGSQLTGPRKVGPACGATAKCAVTSRPTPGAFIQLGVLPDPFTDPVYVGLAVASHDLDAGNVSVLSDVGIRTP